MPKTFDRRKSRAPADAVAHAIAHRIRVDILTLLHDRPASQKELATALHEPLSNITHHVNELAESRAIEVAFTRKVGNVEQNFWRPIQMPVVGADDLAELTVEEHEVFSRIIVQSITAEVLAALRAGKLAGDRYAVTGWDCVWLDEQGYRELTDAAGMFLDRMYEIAAESVARVARTGETRRVYVGAVMAFKRSRTGANTSVTLGHLEHGENPLDSRHLASASKGTGASGISNCLQTRPPADAVAHALNHRVRVDILTLLHDGPASQKELATALREPLSNITHHVDALAAAQAIEVAFSRKVGNVTQNYWRPVIESATYYPEDLAELARGEHELLSRVIVQSISAELLAALRVGHLAGDPYASTAWDRVWLDEQGYRDLNEATGTFFDQMYEAAAESETRVAETGETPKAYIGAVMAFQRSRTEPNTTVTVGHLGRDGLSAGESPSGREPPFEKSV